MPEESEIWTFDRANTYFHQISVEESIKILAAIHVLRSGEFSSVYTKKLNGPIRELIIGPHRIVFFRNRKTLYIVSAFRKKSAKTPKRELHHAERIYKEITSHDL